ncbi:unnamed protein product [Paramecium sonneborni]|uniref:Protein kinase domain-containing protein n=1 Tax=Paramecium sonneborni TaxID=65129 RepID=A0A8S1RHJ7_9CILI|nr:unnamed protein product [Paramecium sonneborni]
MGNTLIEDKGKINLMKTFETYYTEQEIGTRQTLFFENKLFKTLTYKWHQQTLLLKVHLMRKQITLSELHIHTQNFQYLIEQLKNSPNLMPFHNLINFGSTPKPQPSEALIECNKDYLAVSRQFLYLTLEERLQSNYKLPKCLLNFYALQFLSAVNTLHKRNLYHGHIRSSNVLLTSLDFLILADFASYKPTYLNELEIIRNIYKSSIQKCTLAPEKYSDLQEVQYINNLTKGQLNNLQAMDMFSVGCVLAEIFTGESLFSLEQLLQFRKGEYEPIIKIEGVIGDLIRNLISLNPDIRYNSEKALQLFYNEICSSQTYELLQYISVALNVNGYFMQPDARIALLRKIISTIERKQFTYSLPLPMQFINLSKFNLICRDFETPRKTVQIQFTSGTSLAEIIANSLENSGNLIQREFKEVHQDTQSVSVQVSMVQKLKQSIQQQPDLTGSRQNLRMSTFTNIDIRQNNQEYIIIILWISNQIRNSRFMQTRLCGLELIEFLCQYVDDELIYNFLMPCLGILCEDSDSQVQFYAFSIMLNLLKNIKNPPQSSTDTLIFKLYIWEQIKNRMNDMSTNHQLALKIGDIAEILHKFNRLDEKILFLQIIQKKFQDNRINELTLIISKINEVLKYYECNQTIQILTLLISQINTTNLKITLLDVLIDIYKYYLKSQNSDIILYCLQFNTRQESALFRMIRFVRQATEEELLDFNRVQQYVKEISPLILHHNRWIREEAQEFIAILLKRYSNQDSKKIFFLFQPHIKKYLKLDVPIINQEIFLSLIQKPTCSKWFEQKFQNDPRYPPLTEREIYNYNNYYEEYFKRSKNIQEAPLQQQIQKTQYPIAKMNLRVNDFIEAAFRASLMQLDQNRWQDFLEKGGKQQTWEEFVQYVRLRFAFELQNKQDNQLTKNKVKYLQELQFQLQYEVPQSSTQWINLLNYNIIATQIIIKSQQLQIQDLQFQRQIYQPITRPFKISNQIVTTISEHKGIVTSLQKFGDQRRFISGSYDGTVRVYDMKKLEEDFTCGSVAQIKISKGDVQSRVSALCALEGTDSFLVGTNTGSVSLYKNDCHTSTFLKGDSEIRKIVDQENTFMYVTEKGTLKIEDIRSRNGQSFNIGRQRGLVSSMVHDNNTTLIGTINGYLILYDIRSTMIVNLFQLLNHDDQALPIFSLAFMNRVSQFEGMSNDSQKLVGIGYQSNNNEVGFWDLNKQNEDLNPALFLYCSDKKHPIIETPRLQSVLKSEQFINHNNNLQTQCHYDFLNKSYEVDLISYLKDPLTQSERAAKDRWLRGTKNLYINLKSAFECKSTVTSLICLNSRIDNQRQENTFITASTDRSIQSWTLNSDISKQQDKNNDREYQTNIISSPFNSIRRFKQCPSGDVYVIQDYEFKNQSNTGNSFEHKDCITDMIYLDHENSYLVTASRDRTVKIWK